MKLLKKIVLLIIFFTGLTLLVYSWQQSYPLSVSSVEGYVYDKVCPVYWVSLPILLSSTLLLSLFLKNSYAKWIFSLIFFFTLFSLSYFYAMIPTSDSQYFRGLNEYFIQTGKLDPTQPTHSYYQQPAFFMLTAITTAISGINLINLEFLMYTLIGAIIATSLYIYASKKFNEGGVVMVAAFFLSIFYFFNYQAVPFSVAFAILLLLFILESYPKTNGMKLTIAILFGGLLLTHTFVPLFFIFYLLVRSVLDKSLVYGRIFFLCLLSYLAVQLTFGSYSFGQYLLSTMTRSSEYSDMIAVSLTPANPVLIDEIAQYFTRTVTLGFLLISILGFLLLLYKKKLTNIDKSMLITGIVYTGLGVVLYTLGTRAISVAFIPVALGAVYLYKIKRVKPYITGIFLIITILFVSIPIRQSFANEIQYQTKESYQASNFLINYTDWRETTAFTTDFRTLMYIEAKLGFYPQLSDDITKPDAVLYTQGLGKAGLSINLTAEYFGDQGLNRVYDNGYTQLLFSAD